MQSGRTAIKRLVPRSLWNRARTLYWMHLVRRNWYTDPLGRQSQERLKRYRDRYRGERCFIIGNGPSLRQMDLAPLRSEHTFGLNRIYLLFDKLGFSTSFLVCVNDLVLEQCADDFNALELPKFLSWRAKEMVEFDEHTAFLRSGVVETAFSRNPVSHINEGSTVTFVAMQLAYFMGFTKVILIGVDHNFATKGEPHKMVTSTGDDPNHFDPNYFGKGFRWHLPDLDTSEVAYFSARAAFQRDGREVLDATVGGKLQVFPKADYYDLV